jgi:thioredoxin
MKKMNILNFGIVAIGLLIAGAACEANPVQEQIQTKSIERFIKHVNAPEFKRLVDAGSRIILDVRTPEEVAQGCIVNASTINLYDQDFEEKINLIPKEKEICVYCKVGGRSAEAVKILEKNGFNKIYNLRNGIMEWEKEGFPIERSAPESDEKIQTVSLADFTALLETKKPVLVDFHTVWCSPCRKMAPIIDEIEAHFEETAKIMRIDVDKSKELAKEYQIQGVPVFMLFKNGAVAWKHHGVISEEELKAQIEGQLQKG